MQSPTVHTGRPPHATYPASATYKPPSSKDIPPVTLTNITHVEPSAFQPYLSQIGSLYEAFQQAKEVRRPDGREETGKGRNSGNGGRGQSLNESRTSRQGSDIPTSQRHGSLESFDAFNASLSGAEGSSNKGVKKITGQTAAPLSTIPRVYFDEDFHLENPRTFNVVSERSDIVRQRPGTPHEARKEMETGEANGSPMFVGFTGRKPLATNAILQEKLSWYMDIVELHLISSIAMASTSFFAALGSLRALHHEAADSVKQIQNLRSDLGDLDEKMAVGGLKIIRMRRRRDNLRKLDDAVNQLKTIVDGLSECRKLIDSADFELAINAVEELEDLISGKQKLEFTDGKGLRTLKVPAELIDLRALKVLDGISGEVNSFRIRIGKAFELQFVNALLSDLREHVKSVSASETVQRWSMTAQRSRGGHSRAASVAPVQRSNESELRTRLQGCLVALDRANYPMSASTAYRDAILREVKTFIRSHLPSSDDDDTESMTSISTRGGRQRSQQEKSSILARNLRALDSDEAEELLTLIYTNISEMLQRSRIQAKVLLDITSVVKDSSTPAEIKAPQKSPNLPTLHGYLNLNNPEPGRSGRKIQDESQQHLDMSNLLGQVVDVAQTQMTKVLKVRAEQSLHLPLSKFLRYVTLNRLFADDCEIVSGRGGSALKGVVNGHIKEFVTQFGNSERQGLARTMDTDQWDAVDFGEQENRLLLRIVESSTKDADVWNKSTALDVKAAEDDNENLLSNGSSNSTIVDSTLLNGNASWKDKVRRAVLDEQKFILPKSVVAVLNGVDKFQNLIASIPSMNQEVSTNLLEYLKLFNSRSYQLILGAGATRSAGLKNITTKHLALASQALGFIAALIPYVREFVRRHPLPTTAFIVEFDKVKRLYQEHQTGIQDKLVDIMSGRSKTHLNVMKKIDWDNRATARPNVNTYMETLTKETITLHRVLSRHLPEVDVQIVMGSIFNSYKEQWGHGFKETQVTTKEGKERYARLNITLVH